MSIKKIKIRMETYQRFIPSLSYITNKLRGGEEIGKAHPPHPHPLSLPPLLISSSCYVEQ